MECIILGSGTSVPSATRASSGYWLETGYGSILLDCSAAAVHRMAQEGCDWAGLDAIWISHFHLDHCGGLAPFLFGTRHAPETQTRTKPMQIFGPAGLRRLIETFDSAYDYGLFKQPFPLEIVEVEPAVEFKILEGVTGKVFSTPHTEESCAIRITSDAGKSMVFSADTGYSSNLAAFARNTDLFLVECSFIDTSPVKIHLKIDDVKAMMKIANAKRTVATHLYPEFDVRAEEARLLIEGSGIELAHDGMRISVGE